MITISTILTVILAAIVISILWIIAKRLATKFGVDQFWLGIIGLVLTLIVVIWAFGLFGVTQPIVK